VEERLHQVKKVAAVMAVTEFRLLQKAQQEPPIQVAAAVAVERVRLQVQTAQQAAPA
jgi:hypothetical protein